MRKIIIASHNKLADGMKKTLEFISGPKKNCIALSAYVNNKPIEDEIAEIIKKVPAEDELIIFTDMLAGSVNQKFFPYQERPHTHIISGMNLPIILAIVLSPENDYLTEDRVRQLITEARDQLVYVNDIKAEVSDDDE
ncbi:PTS sugar transporter subunit IIA [Sporolactobacillus pectinivorans]|uniref:PTS sugar transporter subunit IIA n=1 Tax=Sporolactobacillus pectinivorans TaxID=1591408 RepID=UPI000C261020|nr:PTS N-acetylglucosamine transporter subunit IIBC [Sporolactobacillus pectinivorans]